MKLKMHATTILAIKKENKLVIAGDGQVTLGQGVMKSSAKKVRRIGKEENIIAGFAGATSDCITLLQRLETKLELYPKQLKRACVELAKDWRTEKYLKMLEAMLIVGDKDNLLVLTGNGDVLEPDENIASVGSGSVYALSAAKALVENTDLDIVTVAEKSMAIAADFCIYTNNNITIETI